MIRRIKKYPLSKLNAINTVTVPEGSVVVTVIGLEHTTESQDVVFALVAEQVQDVNAEVATEELKLLVVNDESPFSDPPDDEALLYVGPVIWDKGYRIHHVFQVETLQDADEEESDYLDVVAGIEELQIPAPDVKVEAPEA